VLQKYEKKAIQQRRNRQRQTTLYVLTDFRLVRHVNYAHLSYSLGVVFCCNKEVA